MKILTAEKMRELDQFTIKNEPISSYDLMERAAEGCYGRLSFLEKWYFSTVYICGKGNNGGDGLAMARMQSEDEDAVVVVIILEHTKEGSPDFAKNLYLLEEQGNAEVVHLKSADEFPEIAPDAVVIDAILGNGLSRPLEGFLAGVTQKMNQLSNDIVSIDIPTGLFADDNSANDLSLVVRADWTFPIHAPKLSLMLPDTGSLAGQMDVVNIGLMEKEMNSSSPYEYVEFEDLKDLYIPRLKFSHKGTYGHALLIAGSRGKMGAAQLGASACLRTGTGLVTTHVPACGLDIMQIGVMEAMCSVDSNHDFIIDLPNLSSFNAIGIGPGIGTEKDTANVLKRLIQDVDASLVLDADALNILGENKTWLSFLPKTTILTPHPMEFERMAGKWKTSLERLQMQIDFSVKYGVIVVLKGAHTSTSTPSGQVFFNSTGNAGMATAGSGDVLTGIILGLLAQGYSPEAAAILGVYIHGHAGDIGLERDSLQSLLASDIIDHIGEVFMELSI
jgi:hydroxyethylthiazole kinase-like uncharacterized protein yjeF